MYLGGLAWMALTVTLIAAIAMSTYVFIYPLPRRRAVNILLTCWGALAFAVLSLCTDDGISLKPLVAQLIALALLLLAGRIDMDALYKGR